MYEYSNDIKNVTLASTSFSLPICPFGLFSLEMYTETYLLNSLQFP